MVKTLAELDQEIESLLVGKTISRVGERVQKGQLVLEFTDGTKVAFGGNDHAGAYFDQEITEAGDISEAMEIAELYSRYQASDAPLSVWMCDKYAKQIDELVGFESSDGRFCWPTEVCDKAEVKTNWRRP
jgi:hypothetical protein